ncbi:pirin family protein [Vibrio sp. 10N.222.51.C8]|jgi:redox-sensitive bicupin YhaK (pirin superfamily)|uniref:pirin family protein n=1 Tax=Vibrio TaxID=662 RepID=UPI000304E22D|nr:MULTISPECIES: pirin family protein [Vibrio]OEE87879.1 quercetin 2,3-dioxygenase [Vibrio crassostreae 9ZC88]PMK13257.1 quercetin 2,3-dioxygenase [Vibrio sp. 10N.261.54.E10]PMK20810.1 quercetin 2,3-dioxygenase [Vibrio sp. 10N.261.54.C3]PMK83005.1 quercetin 2,3-dioxygenase [Vibrio sp. 10N.261.52.E5]PMN95972.1 quercetin 2,3-dioxygenase [Vibrio sp. 10N.222.55.F9]
MTNVRAVDHVITAHATSDGDGVKIQRLAGFNNARFSPFLMIDELKSDESKDYVGGFPPHPHRGIETLTYMLQGHFQHKDHMGNVGELRSGGAQWMAAGRGVIHSEMPMMEEGALHGFQIWINQPATHKMQPAQYHDFQSESIAEHQSEQSGLLRVIAGGFELHNQTDKDSEALRAQGPLQKTGVPLSVADWRSHSGQKVTLGTNVNHNAMTYVYRGSIKIGDKVINQSQLALLTKAELLSLESLEDSGVLIFSGQPINEPVVHYGPFVMNSMEEIEQTIQDYNNGVFETY